MFLAGSMVLRYRHRLEKEKSGLQRSPTPSFPVSLYALLSTSGVAQGPDMSQTTGSSTVLLRSCQRSECGTCPTCEGPPKNKRENTSSCMQEHAISCPNAEIILVRISSTWVSTYYSWSTSASLSPCVFI